MKITILRTAVVVTALGLGSLSSAMADGLMALRQFNQQVDGLAGKFSQTVTNNDQVQKSTGSFIVRRPGMFKWAYDTPFEQLIVGNGKTVWLYDKDLEQVTKKQQATVIGSSPAAILASKEAVEQNFSLSADGEDQGIEYVLATPKDKHSEYHQIRLGFKNQVLVEMSLEDGYGNHTQIKLQEVRINPQMSPTIFDFQAPAGVDVLEAQ